MASYRLNLNIHTEGEAILVDLIGLVTAAEANPLQSQFGVPVITK